ncbi:MAG: hypothetical protein Q7T97_11350 [Burkholderiaceae bacterium]|nr:hypothetical protein [Burkholderiaceae bacterium]
MTHPTSNQASAVREFGDADAAVPVLLARVYEVAPPPERARMLTHLMQPLGLLSLVAVANGVFASLRLRNPSAPLSLRFEDTLRISAADVMALAEHAQQVSVETVDALAQWLTATPVLASSAAAMLLVRLLKRRSLRRHRSIGSKH